MKIELKITSEQIAYLKSLDSKKKKRKFLLDCLIENVEIGESDALFGIKKIALNFKYQDKQNRKSNYSPEEIELVKHNINQKFNQLESQEYIISFVEMLLNDEKITYLHSIITHGLTICIFKDNEIAK